MEKIKAQYSFNFLQTNFRNFCMKLYQTMIRIYRSSIRRCSVRKSVLRTFKKETLAQVFSCEFWEISKNTYNNLGRNQAQINSQFYRYQLILKTLKKKQIFHVYSVIKTINQKFIQQLRNQEKYTERKIPFSKADNISKNKTKCYKCFKQQFLALCPLTKTKNNLKLSETN